MDQFYSACRDVFGLEQRLDIDIGSKKRKQVPWARYVLAPAGWEVDPFNEEEATKAVRSIARTLIELHRLGWCFMDLRWPNVINNGMNEYFLIDSEMACPVGAEIQFTYLKTVKSIQPPPNVAKFEIDWFSLAEMISGSRCSQTWKSQVTLLKSENADTIQNQIMILLGISGKMHGDVGHVRGGDRG